jgi:Flp pilus assembly protein TadG
VGSASNRRRGSAILEFTLVGFPSIFLLISVVEISRGMWQYHTLARAVDKGSRLASIRGRGCNNPNTCGVTVGNIATAISLGAIGLPADSFDVTLVSDSGQTINCRPLASCLSNATVWPPSAGNDNAPGRRVTVTATYPFRSALAMFWPGQDAVQFEAVTFPASSTQRILF